MENGGKRETLIVGSRKETWNPNDTSSFDPRRLLRMCDYSSPFESYRRTRNGEGQESVGVVDCWRATPLYVLDADHSEDYLEA